MAILKPCMELDITPVSTTLAKLYKLMFLFLLTFVEAVLDFFFEELCKLGHTDPTFIKL